MSGRAGAARRSSRSRLALLGAGLLMLLGLGLLIRGALAASAGEQELRREALAARVFDELEGSLAAFVAAEEARPFVQWRPEVVASTRSFGGSLASSSSIGAPKLIRSPLGGLPNRAYVLGYFQIDPEGRFETPMAPGPGEPPASAELRERIELLRELGEDLTGEQRLALDFQPTSFGNRDAPEQQQNAQKPVPQDVQIQRALDQQSIARQRKNAASLQQEFAPDLEQLNNFVGADNPLPQFETELPDDALDLRVTGFVVEPRGDALRLVRTVEIAGQRWLQGVAVDRKALEAWLEQEVLGSAELSGFVRLDWSPSAGPDPGAGRWTHRFAEPFAALEVSAELGPVRVLSSTGARVIVALGIGLALALISVLIAVERSLAGLIARSEERERFIAAVTHELRTPLTSIRMYSEMLEQGMVADPERQRSYHGTIRGEAERLSRLVEQVLSLARLDDRERSLIGEAERAPLESVVAGVVELLRPQADARELRVEVTLEPDAAAVALPRDALAQILTNLIDNAIKFTPVAGGAIELAASRDAGQLRLRVRDRGPGVEPELLAKMFEVFVRGRREHEQATPGTGIGLAVVEALVLELGGRVEARNCPDGGLEVAVNIRIP